VHRTLRHAGLQTLALLSLAAVPAGIGACEDDSAPSDPFAVPPSAVDGGGGSGEAGPPASLPPPGTGIVVTTVRFGSPAAGLRVVFHDASGAVIGDHRTDANGKVAAPAAPSQVTVFVESPEGYNTLLTYVDVEEGDELVVDASPPAPKVFTKPTESRWTVNTSGYGIGSNYAAQATR
jgi:hypothetical protein